MDVQKEIFIALQAEAQQIVEDFAATLSETEREAVGQPERWSAKDLIAHIASWWHIQGERFAQIAQGNHAIDFAWSDEMNGTLFAINARRGWEEIRDELTRYAQGWREAVQKLTVEDLLLRDPSSSEERALWRLVLGNGYLHPNLHLTEHYRERGQLSKATQLQERMAARLVDSLPTLAGLAHYNLACFYALIGKAEEAVNELKIAFEQDAALTSIAQQDEDFASMREQQSFQDLFS